MRQLGICIGHPGRQRLVDARRKAEQHVADHDPGMIAGNMGEARPACHVADGKDPPVAGSQAAVGDDAVAPDGDSGLVQLQPVDTGAPPDSSSPRRCSAGAHDGWCAGFSNSSRAADR